MKKTPVLFVMDHEASVITRAVQPGQEWVLNGEGTATIKFDGTACLWRDGQLWKRYDRKLNKAAQRQRDQGQPLGPATLDLFKTPPEGFVPCEAAPDPVTFHWPGWVPVSSTAPADRWHQDALAHTDSTAMVEGQTYELVGPSLAHNVYGLAHHELWRHGLAVADLPVRTFDTIRQFLTDHDGEGLVFHHPDGRMTKIRRKDFGLFWVQKDTRTHRPRRVP